MSEKAISLRDCKIEDAKTLYKWRNIPEIIELSTLKKRVGWDEHVDWLKCCLEMPNAHGIFLFASGGNDVGVVRFDRIELGRAAISIHLDPSYWGSGLGGEILEASMTRVSENWEDLRFVEADVVSTNTRAIRMFERAGFCKVKKAADENSLKFEYVVSHRL